MEFFFFIVFLAVVFALIRGEKKTALKSMSSAVPTPEDVTDFANRRGESYPRDWKTYEEAEKGAGMQEDLDPTALYRMTKARLNKVQTHAAEKLSYEGLPTVKGRKTPKTPQSLRLQRSLRQPPLMRDMNLSRKLFLSGGRGDVFGERQKKRFSSKTILGSLGLGVIALYLIRVLGA